MKLFIFLVLVLLIVLLITCTAHLLRHKESIVVNFKKWVFPNSVYPNWYKVIQNGYSIKMADTGITLPNNKFSISFMYNLSAVNGAHNNIFRISNTNNDWGNYGDRIRTLWVNPSDPSFLFVLQTDNNVNESISFPGVELNTSALITFLFNSNTFTMYINNVMKYTKIFNDVIVYPIPSNSTLYIGDKFYPGKGEISIQDFTIYDGILTNEQINTIYIESSSRPDIPKKWVFPNSLYPNWHKVIQNGYSIKMIDTGITLPTKKYSISFMYNLTEKLNNWNLLYRITNTANNNCCNDGDRNSWLSLHPTGTDFVLSVATDGGSSPGMAPGNDYVQFPGIQINTPSFVTLLFDNDIFTMYINNVVSYTKTFNNIHTINPVATLYIGDPWHPSNGTINIQDFTIYDAVLRPDQIKTIYTESTKEGRAKKIQDETARQSKMAEEQRTLQKSAETASTLTKLNNQLDIDIGKNDVMGAENNKNRIQQYKNI